MNEEKKLENKKVDKKALLIFIPFLLLSFIAGILMSASQNYMSENHPDIIASIPKAISACLEVISPYVNLVMYGICIIVCVILMANAKKKIKAWDGEDEEVYEKIDHQLGFVLILANGLAIPAYFFFAVGFEYCIGSDVKIVEMICYFLGFIVAMFGNIIIQSKVVNMVKELNPEKQGSVYAMDFQKKWITSCDEAEKMMCYRAAFGSMQVMNGTYVSLWLLCVFGNMVWNFGLMPVTVVSLLWLIQFISYQSYAAYYEKHPNKI